MKRVALLGAAAATAVPTANAEWFRGRSGGHEQKWEPARATTVTSSEVTGTLGWTPKPTPGPAEDALRRELWKRGGTSTCAYFQGTTSPSAAIVCNNGAQCIVNDVNRAMGCCSSSNIQACNVATACIDSTDAQSIASSTAPYTLLCQASTAPSCVMYTYASDSPYSGFRAFSCAASKGVLTVAYTAPGAPSTSITSASVVTTTTAQNSLPSEGGNEPPITISSSSSSSNTNTGPSSSTNPASAGSPTGTSTTGAGGGGATSSPTSAPNNNSNNNTPTILAGVIGGVGGLVIILAGLLSSIFYARKKKKEANNSGSRPHIEKVKRPYMPAAFPNSFDYIAAYRASRRQSERPQSADPPRRSGDLKRINSSRFAHPPMPGPPPRTVRDVRQDQFDFGPRPSPTVSVPVNRNNRGVGPVPATAGSVLGRPPMTRFYSGSTSTLDRPSSINADTNDEPPSAHTDFDSRFTPPFVHSPTTAQNRPGAIGIATVLAPPVASGSGINDRIISTTNATAGSMSRHNSHAVPPSPCSPRSPRSPRHPHQYMLYNPIYGQPTKESPVKRPVGHLNKMQ
ncbi:uncharacterized protein PG998_006882 [Apiospora kogelbergensis]|uniref:uncharacterized protein n=1 Tax=Apiospora kogelbergensis TaxID=1337665 RepID=UPI003130AC21